MPQPGCAVLSRDLVKPQSSGGIAVGFWSSRTGCGRLDQSVVCKRLRPVDLPPRVWLGVFGFGLSQSRPGRRSVAPNDLILTRRAFFPSHSCQSAQVLPCTRNFLTDSWSRTISISFPLDQSDQAGDGDLGISRDRAETASPNLIAGMASAIP